jgi:hypothetical protein
MSTAEERMQSAIEELEQENRLLRARNDRLEAESQKLRENSCRFPLCQTEEYQKDLAEQIKRELYTGSQRTHQWVGLTDEERRGIREWQEIQDELGPVWSPMMLYLYMAIEAKLKEKNT